MCEGRFCAELRLPFFGIVEPNGRTLDLDKSFSVNQHSSIWKKIVKFLFFSLVIATLIGEWVTNEYPAFYMAYLTRWTLMYHVVYTAFSLLTTFYPVQWTIRATWLLFSLASVHGLIIALMFWLTEYDESYDLDFFNFSTHGGIAVCVVIDGFIVNKTPLRLKHIVINMGLAILYFIWSIIQGLAPVDNPYKETPPEPQSMYKLINWDTEPVMTIGVCAGVLFVLLPIFQLLFWAISLPFRTYKAQETIAELNDEEGIGENSFSKDDAHNEGPKEYDA